MNAGISPVRLLYNFDTDLQMFYSSVLLKELNYKVKSNAQNIKKALREVVNAYKIESFDDPSHSIRFNTPAKRCAYVLKHSTCFTSAVARHLLKILISNEHILKSSFLNGEMNIVCLGGGPASDAVAVCKSISVLHKAEGPIVFNITIVDINEDWEVTAKNVLKILQKKKGFFDAGCKVNFSFCRADLTKPLRTDIKEVLKKADVVTMVYFLSAVNGGKDKEESFRMIQEIMKCLSAGTLLFFLDSAREVNYKQMCDAAFTLNSMEEICKPRLEEFHTLSMASVKKFIDIYKRNFGRMICMTNCFVSSGAWFKQGHNPWICQPQSLVKIYGSKSILGPVQQETDLEKEARLTKRMVAYRLKVQKVLMEKFDQTKGESLLEEFEDVEYFCDSSIYSYMDCVPHYFFQTKVKKKRIPTGHPLSI